MTIWTAEVGHEDNGFGAMGGGIFDSGKGADDALIVRDVLVGVERDVEVDLEDDC